MERVRKPVVIAFAVLSLASAARAGVSESLAASAAGFEAVLVRALEQAKPQDAFEGLEACRVLEARFVRPPQLIEAVEMLRPCVEQAARRYSIGLQVKPGAVDLNPVGKRGPTFGVVIWVKGPVAEDVRILADLRHAISSRGGQLLGQPALLRRENPPQEDALRVSVVQESLDRCILPTVVRKVRTGEDFVAHFGGCILKDKSLKVSELRAAGAGRLAVNLLSSADQAVVESLNGFVTVNAESGPVEVLLIAYPEAFKLP